MMPENNATQFHSVFDSNTTVIVCGNDMPLPPFVYIPVINGKDN